MVNNDNDAELLRGYRNGTVDSLAELVERYRRPLYGFILNMTEGREDADEIFQEVWYRVIRKVRTYRHKNFLGWLISIARNLVIDRYRARGRLESLDRTDEYDRPANERMAVDPPEMGRRLDAAGLRDRIMAAVSTLPPTQREVFLMRSVSELPFREIARLQKTSINTALARMHYALGKLRTALSADYEELNAS